MLGYTNTNKAVSDHCHGVPKYYPIVDSMGRDQQARIINEPDLYRLVAHSKMPTATIFEEWVYGEVLPTIRKTGGVYLSPEKAEELICNPDLIIGLAASVLSFQFESWVCLALFFMRRKIPARVAHQALLQGLPPGAFQQNERQQGVRFAYSLF